MLPSNSEEEETGSQVVLGCSQATLQSLLLIPILLLLLKDSMLVEGIEGGWIELGRRM